MSVLLTELVAVSEIARVSGMSTAQVRRAAIARDAYNDITDEVELTDTELEYLFNLNDTEDYDSE
jgi:hypothetical protein